MIGPRIGAKAGPMGGPRIGVGVDELASGVLPTTLTVNLADSVDPVITGGDAFSYTAVVQNTGAADASSVTLTITLDSSLTYVSATGTGWSISRVGQVVTCTLATLATGATANTVTVNVTTGSTGVTASSSASVSATNATTLGTDSENTTVDLVTKDATAGIYVPASSSEWTKFIARKGLSIAVPNHLHLCQEASGNLADSIGSMPLTATGTIQYQQTIAGWTRKGVGFADNAAAKLVAGAGVGPDPNSTSVTFLWITSLPAAPAALRLMGGLNGGGGANTFRMFMNATGTIGLQSQVSASTSASHASGVHPIIARHDRTNSIARFHTDLETVSTTYGATITDGDKGFGAGGSDPNEYALYMVMWSGANAEFNNTAAKALLQAMGYSIPWS